MAHGSATAAGQIKIRTVTETDGVSQIGGHRPGRHIPLSLIGNRYNHYQRNRYNHYQRQIGGHRPGRHIPLSLIGNRYNHYQRNRYNHYQRQIEAVQQNGAAPIGLTSIEQTQLACEIPIIPHIPSQERLFLRDISCESEVGGEKLHAVCLRGRRASWHPARQKQN